MISDLGLVDIDGDLKFQDAAFKILLPTKKMGVFSFFGLGGLSSFSFNDVKPDIWATPDNGTLTGDLSEDFDKGAHLSNGGMNHTLSINRNSFLKTSLSYSSNGIEDDIFKSKVIKLYGDDGEFFTRFDYG